MATIGALVVDMRANTASFETDMGKARSSLSKAGREFKTAEDQAARFASKGLGEIIGAGPGIERALEKLMNGAFGAGGALRALGQTTFVVGGILAVAAAVQKLKEVIGERIFGVEGEEKRLEPLQKEAEEEKKAMEQRIAAATMERQLRADIAKAQGETAVSAAKLINDEIGARRAALQTQLADIEAARVEEIRKGFAVTKDFEARKQIEVLANEKALARIKSAQAQAAVDMQAIEEAASQKRQQIWTNETERFISDLERRRQARENIEQQAAAAAERLGIAQVITQFKQVEELKKGALQVAAGFAAMVDKGIPLRDLLPEMSAASAQFAEKVRDVRVQAANSPAVLDKLDRELADIGWGDFIQLTDRAGSELRDARLDMLSLATDTDTLNRRLGLELPAGINRAIPEIDKLMVRFQLLKQYVDAATRSVQTFEFAVAE
jgi:intracellular sulfur oxidation DsrE/DsrF family protein